MTRFACLTFLLAVGGMDVASAQFFVDSFRDGSVQDASPVSWEPLPPFDTGTFEVVNGDYVLTPGNVPLHGANYYEADSLVVATTFGDVTVQTRLRTLGLQPSWAGVFALANGDQTGLWAAVRKNGDIEAGAFNTATGDEATWSASSSLSPVLDDVNLQMGVSAQGATIFVWRPGEPRPEAPQLVIPTIPSFLPAAGSVGIWAADYHAGADRTPVAFRWFAATPGLYDADFDVDGDVDDDDLSKWGAGFGLVAQATPSDGDANGDASVNGLDLLAWQREVGAAVSTAAMTPVPEPTAGTVLAVASVIVGGRRRMLVQRITRAFFAEGLAYVSGGGAALAPGYVDQWPSAKV